MKHVRNFLRFWYDFIVGDDWVAAAGVVLALIAAALLAQRGLNAWWVMPAAVAVLLAISIGRAARRPE
jgi:hypothetical protein